jgi:hypothetical protein
MSKQSFKVYKGQGYLRLEFDCKNADIETGTTVTAVINYIKPDGSTGSWGSSNGVTLVGTVVKKQMANGDIDQAGDDDEGKWTFQPVITVDGLVGPCDPAIIYFTNTI